MSLRSLLLGSTTALVALGLVGAVALITLTTHMNEAAIRIVDAIESVRAAEELEQSLLIHNRESTMFAITADPTHARRRDEEEKELRRWYTEIGRHVENSEEATVVRRVRLAADFYLSERGRLEREHLAPGDVYARAMTALDEADSWAEELIDVNVSQARALEDWVGRQSRLGNAVGAAVVVILLTLLGGLLIAVRLFVYRPLVVIRQAILRFSAGDRTARAPARGPAELREIAEVFNETASSLNRQREIQLGFLASVAHDLRNPLSTMRIVAGMIEMDGDSPSPEHVRRAVRVVRRQVAQLDRMVGDLLDTARIEAGQLELRLAERDLRDLVREVVDLHGPLSSGHQMIAEIPDQPVPVLCDPVRIEQVLHNLLSNAIKYSPDGGRVGISMNRDGGEAVIAVSDQGIGISPSEQKRIFEPFRRGSSSREEIPGVGLGLSVARRIVEAHNGRIEVESVPGSGSIFRVRLPFAGAVSAIQPGQDARSTLPESSASPGTSPNAG